jgi:transcriptional regulator with PAS, ATPase and Fis domain
LRAEIDYVVNRIPIKSDGRTVGVVLQTAFKNMTEIDDLMKRIKSLEERVLRYKKGLDSMLSATYTFASIIGESEKIRQAKGLAEKYAHTDGSVLILGATGTGKELFAHAIHMAGRRKFRPFVCLNCASIPRDLLESELFGYEQGAFTGARPKGKAGKIELAHKGTLFLDEIGDIPLSAQSKILRVLETRQVDKIGGIKSVNVDFRLIAATNRDLMELMRKGEFREDLFYRLNTMTIALPPLAEREGDVVKLIQYFLAQMGKPHIQLSEQALGKLTAYPWPGNVRELRNVIERAVSLMDGDRLESVHLPECVEASTGGTSGRNGEVRTLAEELAGYERDILCRALEETGNNRSRAARLLGISRSTFYEKCKAHSL